jgi:hypothetical protein
LGESIPGDSVPVEAPARSGPYAEGDLLQMAEPEHGNLRKQVGHVFSPKAVADLESRITKLADELLDGLTGRDRIDLVADFADPLSGTLFCELLGIPVDDRELFRLVQQSIDSPVQLSVVDQGGDQQSYLEAQLAHLAPLRDRLKEHIAHRRQEPSEDLIGLLTRLRKLDGSGLNDNEVVNLTFERCLPTLLIMGAAPWLIIPSCDSWKIDGTVKRSALAYFRWWSYPRRMRWRRNAQRRPAPSSRGRPRPGLRVDRVADR